MELGSTAINQTAENAEKFGMVMSNQDIAQMRKYERALNDMQTSFKGLGIQLALALGPTLTGVFKGVSEGIAKSTEASKFFKAEGADAAVEAMLFRAGMLSLDDAVYRLNPNLRETGYWLDDEGNAISNLRPKIEGLAEAYSNFKNSLPVPGELPSTPETGQLKDMSGADIYGISNQIKWRALGGELLNGVVAGITSGAETGALTDPIAQSFLKNADTIQSAMKLSMGEPIKNLAKDFSDKWGGSAKDAEKAIRGVGSTMAALNGMQSYLDIYVRVHVSGGGGYTGTGTGGPNISDAIAGGFLNIKDMKAAGNAKGANFTVPSGFPNDSFPMLVESGERVIVIPRNKANQIPKFSQGIGYEDWSGASGVSGGYTAHKRFNEYLPIHDTFANKGFGNIDNPEKSPNLIGKSVEKSITPAMSGLITTQNAKTAQQISTISSRQAETAQKNSMISGDMLSELVAIRKGIEKLPVDVRDAVLLA